MSMYITLMNCHMVTVKVRVAPRTNPKYAVSQQSINIQPDDFDPDPMIKRYIARSNNRNHLIFNPKVSMILESRQNRNQIVMIPAQLIYQFASILSDIYQSLSESDWYYKDEGRYHIATEEVKKYTKRFSVARDYIYMYPTIIHTEDQGEIFGVMVSAQSTGEIGVFSHIEVSALIRLIEALDLSTYTLLAGAVESLMLMDDRIKAMDTKLNSILTVLQKIHMDQAVQQLSASAYDIPQPAVTDSIRQNNILPNANAVMQMRPLQLPMK